MMSLLKSEVYPTEEVQFGKGMNVAGDFTNDSKEDGKRKTFQERPMQSWRTSPGASSQNAKRAVLSSGNV